MAIVQPNREEIRQEEWIERDFWAAQEAQKREHEYRLARLKYSTQTRHKAVERVLVAMLKAPACLALAVSLPRLEAAGKETPKFLKDFMSL